MKIKDLDEVLEVATTVAVVCGDRLETYSDYNEMREYENGDADIVYMACQSTDKLYIVVR